MKDILLSIVIPAYNAERYLRKCLDSCLNQKGQFPKYEIIVVNDGSTDVTQMIIDEYLKSYPLISCIQQENGGLSKARNEGLKKAQGEYIWFIDSDDWIEEDALVTVANVILKKNPDSILIRCVDHKPKGDSVRQKEYFGNGDFVIGESILQKIPFNTIVTAWLYIHKVSFLKKHKLTFMEGVVYEDSEFTPRLLTKAKNMVLLNDILYNVRFTPNSLGRNHTPQKVFDFCKIIRSQIEYKSQIMGNKTRKAYNSIISMTLNAAIKKTYCLNAQQLTMFKENISIDIIRCLIFSSNIKYVIEGVLLLISKDIAFKIVKRKL